MQPDKLEQVWQAAAFHRELEQLQADNQPLLPEHVLGYVGGLAVIDEARQTLLPRFAESSTDPEAFSQALFEALLSSQLGDSAEKIGAHALRKTLFDKLKDPSETVRQAAQATIIEQYKQFVYVAARKLNQQLPKRAGADVDDLIQVGMMKVLKSADTYDVHGSQGTFLTYAASGIVRSMIEHFDDMAYPVRLPRERSQDIKRHYAMNAARRNRRGPLLDQSEIAQEFELYDDSRLSDGVGRVTVGDFQQAILLTRNIGSLDSGYSPHNDTPGDNDYIIDERNAVESLTQRSATVPVDEAALQPDMRLAVEKLMQVAGLDALERDIMRFRFGLADGELHTEEETCRQFDIKKIQIMRKLAQQALTKLRHRVDTEGHSDGIKAWTRA
jgi:RNA polymerase sigma factor (sigma-70 family)